MSDTTLVMSSFLEVEPAVTALDKLRGLGLSDDEITVRSSLPLSAEILGRPHVKTRLPRISLVSALVGLGLGLFFTVLTPYMYIVRVGGQPIIPVPPTLLLLYEFTMLALIIGTFGGFLVLNRFPSRQPQAYDPQLNDGRINLVVKSPADKAADVAAILAEQGGEVVEDPERSEL